MRRSASYLIVSNDFIAKLLVFECDLDVVSLPVSVKELVGHFIFFLQAKLNPDDWEFRGFAHLC